LKCAIHPDVETNLTCAECGRPICPKCMVYTPVGGKCPDCVRHHGRTVAGPRPIYYVRAAGAGLGAALIGGVLLGQLAAALRFGGLLLVIFFGLAIGEIVSRAAGRNTGPAFQAISGISAALAFLMAGYFTGRPVLIVFALVGIYLASMRLKD
jgi:hypothetical protein